MATLTEVNLPQEDQMPTLSDVVSIPKNSIVDGIITEAKIQRWSQVITDAETLKKFKDPEQKMIFVKFKTDLGINGSDKFYYTDKPTSTSRLGKFLKEFGLLKFGTKVKIKFDTEGKSEISL
jgi:hypothetical protein